MLTFWVLFLTNKKNELFLHAYRHKFAHLMSQMSKIAYHRNHKTWLWKRLTIPLNLLGVAMLLHKADN